MTDIDLKERINNLLIGKQPPRRFRVPVIGRYPVSLLYYHDVGISDAAYFFGEKHFKKNDPREVGVGRLPPGHGWLKDDNGRRLSYGEAPNRAATADIMNEELENAKL